MFTGRTQELERLEAFYASERSGIVVLYGRSGIGKTALTRRFLQGKQAGYYTARRVTTKEQFLCMKQEWKTEEASDFYEAFTALYASYAVGGKFVLVLDEFRNLLEDSTEFLAAFLRFYAEHHGDGTLLVLLLSSSVSWVENEMTGVLGNAARLVQGFIKLKEFSFMELAGYHKGSSVQENIYTGAVLGGIPAYLRLWNEKDSFKDNIVRLFLSEDAPLFEEAERYLKKELRELSAYNTILAALAQGKYKLNDIYAQTGFSRAKISVYLKNLTELDCTEKLFSFDTSEQRSVQKGLYRIREPFLRFWYRFVYPNLSEIALGHGEQVYETCIAPQLTEFVQESFSDVCGEYLQVMNRYGQLADSYGSFGVWYGKIGKIDVAAKTAQGNCLVGFCDCGTGITELPVLKRYGEILESAVLKPTECYCFSMQGFSKEFEAAANKLGIRLVCAKDM
ncbi:MAG: ATP-binding protein [Lachnospiraceae bacterium]|nr:ATP-binding protein [Lachnospiraceae bacterium]